MSINISHGYIIDNMSPHNFQLFCDEFVKKIKDQSLLLITKQQAIVCQRLIDTAYLWKEDYFLEYWSDHNFNGYKEFDLFESPLSASYKIMQYHYNEIKEKKIRKPDYDFECSVAFYVTEERTYCLLYSLQESYNDIWNSMNGVHPYPYWNSSEGIEGIDWEKRKNEWFKAFGNTWFTDKGTLLDCEIEIPIIPLKDMIDCLPSFEKRINKYSFNEIVDDKANEIRNQNPDYSLYRPASEALDWVDTKDGLNAIEKKKDELQNVLKKIIEIKDLEITFNNIYENKNI